MKYITNFETQAAYDAAKDNLITPNVSYIEATNGVAYKPIPQELLPTITQMPVLKQIIQSWINYECLQTMGEADNGTFYYCWRRDETPAPSKESSDWTSENPIAEDSGYVWYYVKGNQGYSDIEVTYLGYITMAA